MTKPSLQEVYIEMSKRMPNDALKHYAITIGASKEGEFFWSVQGEWAGFADEECKVEIRQASLVRASILVKALRDDLRDGCVVVETLEELEIFLLVGGHAVIEKDIAEKSLPEFLEPQQFVKTGFLGFRATDDLPETIFQKAPTKTQRMRVLKRDGYRCKICGRAPHNNVDITLHVHHIHPWANRGLTHEDNLITLCHTCHEGLDPHNELSLFSLLNESGELIDLENSRRAHFESVRKYRELSFEIARKKST